MTFPAESVFKREPSTLEIVRFVDEAREAKSVPADRAVDDAYGNCDAAMVDDAKNTP